MLKGRSIFADRVGEEVAAPNLTLVDDPTNPLAYTASRDRRRRAWPPGATSSIEGGVLQQFVQSSYSARRSGTALDRQRHAGRLQVDAGLRLPRPLAGARHPHPGRAGGRRRRRRAHPEVAGLHSGVNPVSGDFSTGASGLVITGGTLGGPVREFTIASTLQRMLKDVVEVGGDVDWLPMRAAGVSLVIRDVTMSGA